MENQKDKRLDQILKLIEATDQNMFKIRDLVDKIQNETKTEEYKSMPGLEGVFDGVVAITESGEKIEVPANYAAKSRLVYGDVLKVIEEDGKKLFKQLQKVPRKKLDGIVSKKEGRWYVLTDAGSYRISDVAAEFNKLQINDQVVVIIPETNLSAPYASLDKVLTVKDQPVVTVPNVVSTPVQAPKPVQKIITQPKRAPQKSVASKPYIPAQAAKPQVAPVPVTPVVENNNNEERELDLTKREFVMDIKPAENKATPSAPKKDSVDLDDDDLR